MDLNEYRQRFSEGDSAPGWEAIDSRLAEVYPGVEPAHFAAVPHYALGGDDPVDGVSIYRCTTADGEWHYHYVTYGFSNLHYDEEAVGRDYSGFGFELTFRLKPFAEDTENPTWVIGLLQNLARYVFKTGNGFDDHHWLDAKGPIRLDTATDIVGLAFVTDPVLGVIESPHGEVKFLQAVGITAAELRSIREGAVEPEAVLEALRRRNPLLVTDLERPSSAPSPGSGKRRKRG